MVRIGILQFQDDAPAAWMGDWLLTAGCTLDVRTPGRDPLTLEGLDALVVMGGSPSATDDDPRVSAARDLVREAADRGLPTLGICLGHQVCAVALGGQVERNPRGQQLGLVDVGWVEDASGDPLLGSLTDIRRAVQWNDDVVTILPVGATLLAATPAGEVQAARFAPTVWGVQWHPEVDDTVIAAWARQDASRHDPGVVEAAVEAVREARSDLERDWRRLAEELLVVATR